MILVVIFYGRVLFYQEQAEKWAMVGVVSAVQSALILQQSHLRIQGKESKIHMLAMVNPMGWLELKPQNYVGEIFDPAPDEIVPGNWAFDLKSRELIYMPEHDRHLTIMGGEKHWIRYRVNLEKNNFPNAGGKKGGGGISFEPVAAYRWDI